MTATVLDRLLDRLRERLEYNSDVQVAPIALLWPDRDRQWENAIDEVGRRLNVLTLGDYDPERRRGPAYWIRSALGRQIDTGLTDGPPVVYLPGVDRQAMRPTASCPPDLAPIAELQYRSQWFTHRNHRDWTIRAFLANSDRGLGLRLADDAETTESLGAALIPLFEQPIDRISRQTLDADFCRQLVNPDSLSLLLGWLDDPAAGRERLDDNEWHAFVRQCRADYEFDPEADGELTAAGLLGRRQGLWGSAWNRFAEAPERFPGIAEKLGRARPDELIVAEDSWPQDNERAEERLRAALLELASVTAETARKRIVDLEAEHGGRRTSVWADLGAAPLALASAKLADLVELARPAPPDANLADLVAEHTNRGWRVDDAAMRALAAGRSGEDRKAIRAALATAYLPWLEEQARAMQAAVATSRTGGYKTQRPPSPQPGTVVVFVDGLRLDIARRLEYRLAENGFSVTLDTDMAALPTVTATAKAAVMPLPSETLTAGSDLNAANAKSGTDASIAALRAMIAEAGIQVIDPRETGEVDGRGWTEAGALDAAGHRLGEELVDELDRQIELIAARLQELLDAGWKRIEVITDHGWLLVPEAMGKVELPATATEVRKGRCARLKPDAAVNVETVAWFWDADVSIAIAPGISCFEAGKSYEHGGVSPQECVVPCLRVERPAANEGVTLTKIERVSWVNLLCRIELASTSRGVIADIRTTPADPASTIVERPKETKDGERVTLIVPDEDHEGESAFLVILDHEGRILAQRAVIVGGER